jgi:hypothetical protein
MAQFLINVPNDVTYSDVENAISKVSGHVMESHESDGVMCVNDRVMHYHRSPKKQRLSNKELYDDAMTLEESEQLLLEHIHYHFHQA